jgi:hypothetical protein
MDEKDALSLRIKRALKVDDLALVPNRSLILPDIAGKDFHQRRFAGAVLAAERMDLAGAEIEIDIGQRARAGEVLYNAGGLQNRNRRRLGLAGCGFVGHEINSNFVGVEINGAGATA